MYFQNYKLKTLHKLNNIERGWFDVYDTNPYDGIFLDKSVENDYRIDLCRMPYDQVYGRYNSITIRSNNRYGKYPTYENVDNKFKDYKEFISWFYNEQDSFRLPIEEGHIPPGLEYHLDKDLLGTLLGLNEYSKKTCIFLPRYINALLELNGRGKQQRPLGVDKGRILKRTGRMGYSVYVTAFGKNGHILIDRSAESLEIGFMEYKICKEYIIHRTAEEFYKRGLITPLVYYALLVYSIRDISNSITYSFDRSVYIHAYNVILKKNIINKIELNIMTNGIPFIDQLASKIKTFPMKDPNELLGPYERSLLFRHRHQEFAISEEEYEGVFKRRLWDMVNGDFTIPKFTDYDFSKMRK